jgi:hypothetical protein
MSLDRARLAGANSQRDHATYSGSSNQLTEVHCAEPNPRCVTNKDLMALYLSIPEGKTISPQREDLRFIFSRHNRKVPLVVKYERRAIIEFLSLEGCSGDKIARHLQSVPSQDACQRASVLQWINEIRNGSEEFQTKVIPGHHVDIKPIGLLDPSYTKIRMLQSKQPGTPPPFRVRQFALICPGSGILQKLRHRFSKPLQGN